MGLGIGIELGLGLVEGSNSGLGRELGGNEDSRIYGGEELGRSDMRRAMGETCAGEGVGRRGWKRMEI